MLGKCQKELFLLELDLAMTKKEVRNSGLHKIRLIFLSLLEKSQGRQSRPEFCLLLHYAWPPFLNTLCGPR